jgi:hypothetical protein
MTLTEAKRLADEWLKSFDEEKYGLYTTAIRYTDKGKLFTMEYEPERKIVFVTYGKYVYSGFVSNGETVRWTRENR